MPAIGKNAHMMTFAQLAQQLDPQLGLLSGRLLPPLKAAGLGADGRELITAVVQDAGNSQVLMLAWMDPAALGETITTGQATYYSRSRQGRWRKGETSGHAQQVRELRVDCDGDAVLLLVEQLGAACHTGQRSCFHNPVPLIQSVSDAPEFQTTAEEDPSDD